MSRLRLRVLESARSDLLEIKAWLTQPGSGRRAWARYSAVVQAVIDLRSGSHRWPFGDQADVRERPIEGYRIYYRVDDGQGQVEILRIFAPGQDRRL